MPLEHVQTPETHFLLDWVFKHTADISSSVSCVEISFTKKGQRPRPSPERWLDGQPANDHDNLPVRHSVACGFSFYAMLLR